MSQSRLIGTIALVTWLLVAVPVLLYHVPDGSLGWQWTAVYLGFGTLFALDLRRPHVLFLALASAAALYLVVLRCNGYEGALLALVAMRLGTRMRRLTGIAWMPWRAKSRRARRWQPATPSCAEWATFWRTRVA